MLYGDLYEIAKLSDEEMTDPESGYLNVLTGEEGSGQIPAVFGYHAPEGYAYRQLNPEDSETMCEISGRCACHLFGKQSDDRQIWPVVYTPTFLMRINKIGIWTLKDVRKLQGDSSPIITRMLSWD